MGESSCSCCLSLARVDSRLETALVALRSGVRRPAPLQLLHGLRERVRFAQLNDELDESILLFQVTLGKVHGSGQRGTRGWANGLVRVQTGHSWPVEGSLSRCESRRGISRSECVISDLIQRIQQ